MIILFVESFDYYLNQYKEYLKNQGHQVKGVPDGAKAIEVIADQTEVIEAVITSYEVGTTVKGLAVLDAIKQSGRNVPTLLQHPSGKIIVSVGGKELERFLTVEVQAFPFAHFAPKTNKSTHIDEFLANINYPTQSKR